MKKFHIVFKTNNREIEFDPSQQIVTTGKSFEGINIVQAILNYEQAGYEIQDVVIVYSVGPHGNIEY